MASDISAWLIYDIAGLLISAGRTREATRILEPVVREARDLAERLKTPEALRDLSVSLNNVGKAAAVRGDHAAAAEAYQESLAVRRDLAERLKTPEALRDLSVSLDNVGQAAAVRGDHAAAAEAYHESLAVSRDLAERLKTPEALRDLAISHERIGDMQARQGETAEAIAAFERALGVYQALLARNADDIQSRLFSVVPLWRLGGLKGKDGRHDLEAALAILKPLADADRLDANRREWIALIEDRIAALER